MVNGQRYFLAEVKKGHMLIGISTSQKCVPRAMYRNINDCGKKLGYARIALCLVITTEDPIQSPFVEIVGAKIYKLWR